MEFQNPREIVGALRSQYVEAEQVEPELNIWHLFQPPASKTQKQAWLNRVAEELSAQSLCAVTFERIEAAVERRTSSSTLAYVELVLAFSGVLIDVTLQYPGIERRVCTRRLNDAVSSVEAGDPDIERLTEAGAAVYDRAAAVALGHRISESVDPARFVHPENSREQLQSLLREQIECGRLADVRAFRDQITAVQSREWTHEDLLLFDPYEFEGLLATLWRKRHDAAGVTRKSQDRGIDVVVETAGGNRVLVQAKRHQPGNPVGIAPVQRTAGLLCEFEADRTAVVTSSGFTESATASGEAVETLSLIDGRTLCRWLTKSGLYPPFEVERASTGDG